MHDQLEQHGRWLFRRRSFLPLILLALPLAALPHFRYPLGSHALDQLWELACMSVSMIGLVIRFITAGSVPDKSSGRTRRIESARSLNTTGMYSVVRNPLYLGNFFLWLGVSLFMREWWLPVVFALAFALYHERIIAAEEAFLNERFGEVYRNWARATPAFLPRLKNWRPAALPFSARTALKREYRSFFAMIGAFAFLETATEIVVDHRWLPDALWTWILLVSLPVYLVLRFLDKHTSLLESPDRSRS